MVGGWKVGLGPARVLQGEPQMPEFWVESRIAMSDRGMKLLIKHLAPTEAEVRKGRMTVIPVAWRPGTRTEVRDKLAKQINRKETTRRSAYQDWGNGVLQENHFVEDLIRQGGVVSTRSGLVEKAARHYGVYEPEKSDNTRTNMADIAYLVVFSAGILLSLRGGSKLVMRTRN